MCRARNQLVGVRAARGQQPAQVVGHREHAPVAVLGGAGVEPDLAGREVDLSPFEREDLGRRAPAGDVGELRDVAQRLGQVGDHCLELCGSKNPARVLLSFSFGMCGR